LSWSLLVRNRCCAIFIHNWLHLGFKISFLFNYFPNHTWLKALIVIAVPMMTSMIIAWGLTLTMSVTWDTFVMIYRLIISGFIPVVICEIDIFAFEWFYFLLNISNNKIDLNFRFGNVIRYGQFGWFRGTSEICFTSLKRGVVLRFHRGTQAPLLNLLTALLHNFKY
jgi:hypothetical protein